MTHFTMSQHPGLDVSSGSSEKSTSEAARHYAEFRFRWEELVLQLDDPSGVIRWGAKNGAVSVRPQADKVTIVFRDGSAFVATDSGVRLLQA